MEPDCGDFLEISMRWGGIWAAPGTMQSVPRCFYITGEKPGRERHDSTCIKLAHPRPCARPDARRRLLHRRSDRREHICAGAAGTRVAADAKTAAWFPADAAAGCPTG